MLSFPALPPPVQRGYPEVTQAAVLFHVLNKGQAMNSSVALGAREVSGASVQHWLGQYKICTSLFEPCSTFDSEFLIAFTQ